MSLLIAILIPLAAALVVFWIEPLTILPLLERLTPNLTYRIPTRHPLVAISFDDGPHPIFTPQVLDILHQHNAHATFFLIGERALTSPTVRSCTTPMPTSSITSSKPKKPSGTPFSRM